MPRVPTPAPERRAALAAGALGVLAVVGAAAATAAWPPGAAAALPGVVVVLAVGATAVLPPRTASLVSGAAVALWAAAAVVASLRGAPPLALALVGGALLGAVALASRTAGRLAALGEAVQQESVRADALSVRDELTGLANRSGVAMVGRVVLEQARRRGDAVTALVVDVEGTALVNAELGRTAGDEVLLSVAEALQSVVRGTDVVGRGPGDSFVVVGPGTGMAAIELERRVRAHLVERPPVSLRSWDCRVSVGRGCLEPWDGGDVEDALGRAEADLQLRRALRLPSAPEPTRQP